MRLSEIENSNAVTSVNTGMRLSSIPDSTTTITAEPMSDIEKTSYQMQPVQEQLKKEGVWDYSATMPEQESGLRRFAKTFAGELPENIGATSGALIGAKYAGQIPIPPQYKWIKPATVLAGAVGGAFLGGMGGSGYKEAYKQYVGEEHKPLSEQYKTMAQEGGKQAAYELAGRGVAKIAKTAIGNLIPTPSDVIEGSQEANKLLNKYGGQLTAAQMTETALLDKLDDVAEGSFLGGSKITKLKTVTNPQAISKMTDSLLEDFAQKAGGANLSNTEVGLLVRDTISGGEVGFKVAAKKLYKKVSEQAANATVDMKPIKQFAQNIQSQIAEAGNLAPTQKRLLINKISTIPDSVSFEGAQEIRSNLRQLASQLAAKGDETKGIASKMQQMAQFEMSKSAKNLSPEAYSAWREADMFYREGKLKFNNKLIRNLSKQLENRPEAISEYLHSNNSITQAQKLKAILPEKTWNKVKYTWLEDFLTKRAGTKEIEGGMEMIKGQTALNNLNKYKNLNTIFTSKEINSMQKVFRAAKLAQDKTGAGGGKMLIQLAQGGAVLGLFTGTLKKGASTILIAPPILAHLATNPKVANWLAMGHALPSGTPEAMALGLRILGEAVKVEKMIKEQESVTNEIESQKLQPTMAEKEQMLMQR